MWGKREPLLEKGRSGGWALAEVEGGNWESPVSLWQTPTPLPTQRGGKTKKKDKAARPAKKPEKLAIAPMKSGQTTKKKNRKLGARKSCRGP